ncbi:hypothetical protein SLA2020_412410 [Shorea laevis]
MECVFGLVGEDHGSRLPQAHRRQRRAWRQSSIHGVIQKNVALTTSANGIPLTTAAAANFTRGELATALRTVRDSPLLVESLFLPKKPVPRERHGLPLQGSADLWLVLVRIGWDSLAWMILLQVAVSPARSKDSCSGFQCLNLGGALCPSLYYIDYIATLHKLTREHLVTGPIFPLDNGPTLSQSHDGAREYAWRETVKDAAVASA